MSNIIPTAPFTSEAARGDLSHERVQMQSSFNGSLSNRQQFEINIPEVGISEFNRGGYMGEEEKKKLFKRSKGKVLTGSVKSVDNEHHEIVLSVDEVEESGELVAELTSSGKWKTESLCMLQKPHSNVMMDSAIVKMLVDSGSLFTFISRETYEKTLGKKFADLLKTDIKTVGYGGKRIEILGMQWTDISFKDNEVHGKVYVTGEGSNLLGWRHQKDLNIILDPNAQEPVIAVERMADVEYLKSNEQWCEEIMAKFP
ncbi:hypothetical protein NDU88_004506 [Pleurodeles waltl]|uniref:Peptidase A2 domain-containing protein n=1 Tax=Pleurodeles waltl TaxID=8319 RepID=A0AAV7TRQ1_PLEWA|nr:hypothetical protein NDU88_004506 [Pleurodeles waltl]